MVDQGHVEYVLQVAVPTDGYEDIVANEQDERVLVRIVQQIDGKEGHFRGQEEDCEGGELDGVLAPEPLIISRQQRGPHEEQHLLLKLSGQLVNPPQSVTLSMGLDEDENCGEYCGQVFNYIIHCTH